ALHQLSEEAARREAPRDLREIRTAGEQLRIAPAMADFFTRLGPGFRLYNDYGPSETHVVTSLLLAGSPAAWPLLPPIGRPVAGTQVYVLDRSSRPVPVGVAGELYLGGQQVGRGYHGRPDLTAERFQPDPFGPESGGRLYRTGDLARWSPDGNLEFLGRSDDQVKVRGFRIELGEIETALAGLPGVAQAAAALSGEGEARRLVAWVVPQSGAGPFDAAEMRTALRRSLPEYMVPSAVVEIPALPLTPNGKLDRRALPDPGQPSPAAGYVPPRDPVEEELAAIWARLLRVERVGIHDNFFALGGHSLTGTRVLAAVREAFGVDVPLRTLFERPTVAELALAVESRDEAGATFDRIPRLPRDTDRFPVSASQLREWLLDRLLPGGGAFNIPGATRVLGPLDRAVLTRSLREIVRRHESLRTTFAEGESEPVQVIAPDLALAVPLADLSVLPPAVREAEVRRLSREEIAEPFELARGPLLRVRLLRLADCEHLVLFTIHHIVSDGWSMGVFFRELATLYVAF